MIEHSHCCTAAFACPSLQDMGQFDSLHLAAASEIIELMHYRGLFEAGSQELDEPSHRIPNGYNLSEEREQHNKN